MVVQLRTLLTAVTISVVACGHQESRSSPRLPRIALSDSPALSQATNPKPSTIVSPDSSSLIAPEDSILDELGAGEGAVLPNGDTIKRRGGYLISENLGVDYYTKNGTRYLRIQRLVGHKPNGQPCLGDEGETAPTPESIYMTT
jgi:hypothetical protein